jgi:hypothetical protein
MGREYLFCLVLVLFGGSLFRTADSAKITCKICKKFVDSFKKVKWLDHRDVHIGCCVCVFCSNWMPLPILVMQEGIRVGRRRTWAPILTGTRA